MPSINPNNDRIIIGKFNKVKILSFLFLEDAQLIKNYIINSDNNNEYYLFTIETKDYDIIDSYQNIIICYNFKCEVYNEEIYN